MWALTPTQAAELREHLSEMLPSIGPDGRDLESAVKAIDFAAAFMARGFRPGEWRKKRNSTHRHMLKVAHFAELLSALLNIERPRWGLAGLDLPTLHHALARVAESARSEALATAPKPDEPKRPPDLFRDQLVSVIYSVYPPGTAKRTPGSHFEQTVEMVLGYVGKDLQSGVHGLVLDALRRTPEPPFTVKSTRPRRAK